MAIREFLESIPDRRLLAELQARPSKSGKDDPIPVRCKMLLLTIVWHSYFV